jgi:hypothetical protein
VQVVKKAASDSEPNIDVMPLSLTSEIQASYNLLTTWLYLLVASVFVSSLDCSATGVSAEDVILLSLLFSSVTALSVVVAAVASGRSSYRDTVTTPSSSLTILTRTFLGGLVLPLDHT